MGKEDLVGFTLTIFIVLITLILPLPLSQDIRLAVIGGVLIFYLSISLFKFNRRLNEQSSEQKRLEEKLKIHEQLIDIKKDIELLKNGKKNRHR
tara:strand:+ start:2251 stop:2532 length:282 start_codon:yes stop_codon:yes gene_type:complete